MRELLSRLSCPLCGGMRDDSLLVVIDTPLNGAGSVRAQCVRCHLAWAFPLEDAPYPTEWRQESADRADEPISADEVVDVHRILRDFHGSLVELLERSA